MIEVNLVPGSARKKAGPKLALPFKLPIPAELPKLDKWLGGIVGGWVVGLGLLAFLFLGVRGQRGELLLQVEDAVRDSTKYAQVIATNDRLRARRDTIAQKLQVIQEIDAGRYIWSHVLDEISRTLPEYTWLTNVQQIEGGAAPQFRIQGRTGNTFALTNFMKDLEASPFVRNVKLASTEQLAREERLMHEFVLEAAYEEPPVDVIRTVPLFASEEGE